LIENAIDIEQFNRTLSVASAKQSMGWATDKFYIGAVGRLSPEKAFDLLIRAFHKVMQRGAGAQLVIAGEGPERDKLAQLVRELGLQQHVTLLGYRSDLRTFYQALDLFVLSSVREALPNVLLEAMAMKVPVVATRVAGVPQLVCDGEHGWLVAPNDASALADCIERSLAAPQLRAQFAESARRTIEHRYAFATRMKKVAALYDELLSKQDVAQKTQ
jgi:glycosyltransferase involved in cell wall biosynthesis